jgi:hypothetical protein
MDTRRGPKAEPRESAEVAGRNAQNLRVAAEDRHELSTSNIGRLRRVHEGKLMLSSICDAFGADA